MRLWPTLTLNEGSKKILFNIIRSLKGHRSQCDSEQKNLLFTAVVIKKCRLLIDHPLLKLCKSACECLCFTEGGQKCPKSEKGADHLSVFVVRVYSVSV